MDRARMEGNAVFITLMFKLCKERTIKGFATDSLTAEEEKAFTNCVTKSLDVGEVFARKEFE